MILDTVHIYHKENNSLNNPFKYIASKSFSDDMITVNEMLQLSYNYTKSYFQEWIDYTDIDVSLEIQELNYCRSTRPGDVMNIVSNDSSSKWFTVLQNGFSEIKYVE